MGGDVPSTFGDVLRAHRLRSELTQAQLAERSGISVRALRYIERGGVGRPRPDSVRRLAAAMGVSPDELAEDAATAPRPAPPGLCFGVLGPFTIAHGGRPVEVGALKQRSLLALLALRANQVVRREEIVDVLWGEDPPDSCLALVHTYVSRLRRALVAVSRRNSAVIESIQGGYRLVATTDRVDALRFDDRAGRGNTLRESDPQLAADLLDEALSSWRGPVLVDLPAALREHPAALGLAARRLDAALAYADLMLALGNHDVVVTRVRPLALAEPLHEGLHARLMLGLAGTGERAAALAVFADLRARLADELGVEPGAEVQEVHLRVLRKRTGAVAGEQVPAQLPAEAPGFVGRAGALERLDGLLDQVDGHSTVVAVSGSAGVGKTALALRWAHQVRDRFPDGQLAVDLRGYAPGSAPTTHQVLVRFLHALGVQPERIPAEVDEAAGLYRTILTGKRVLVLLDNAASAEQVRPLLPGAPGCFVLVTSRDRLTGLTARDGAHPLPLDVLAPQEAVDLLGGLLGELRTRREADAAAEMADTCAHLPLALRIAGANLAVRPLTSVADYTRELRDRGRITGLAVAGDESGAVRAAFDLSYEKLVPAARRVFRLLGLVPGGDVNAEAVAALCGTTRPETARLLRVLVDGNLIHEHTPGRYRFHDLLREYAADRALRADDLHARRDAVEALFEHYLERVRAHSALLWQIQPATEGAGGERAAIDWLDTELANLAAAATSAVDLGLPRYAWAFAEALRAYFDNRGHGVEGIAVCEAALSAARAAADLDAQASVHDLLGTIHCNRSDFAAAVEHHEWALELSRGTGNRVVEASALHNLGRAHQHLGQSGRAAERHTEALEINRAIGNRRGEATALHYLGVSALSLGRTADAVARHTEALELSTTIDHRRMRAAAAQGLGLAHWATGDLRAAIDCHREALDVCRRYGYQLGEVSMLLCLSEALLDAGAHTTASTYVRQAIDLARELGERRHEVSGLDILAGIQQRTGEWSAAADHYTRALTLAREIGFVFGESTVLMGLCALRRRTGDRTGAIDDGLRSVTRTRETGLRLLEPRALTELAHARLEAGDLDAAESDIEQALVLAAATGQRLVEARAGHVRALLRQTRGDLPSALTDWRRALRVFAEAGTPEEAHVRALLAVWA